MSDLTDSLIAQVQNGIRTIDEAREALGLPAFGLPETSQPVVYTSQGPMTLSRADELVKRETPVTSQLSAVQINALVKEIQSHLLKRDRANWRAGGGA